MNKFGLGQLRHLYTQMLDGYLLQDHLREAAKYLLAPGIEEMERLYEENERLLKEIEELKSRA